MEIDALCADLILADFTQNGKPDFIFAPERVRFRGAEESSIGAGRSRALSEWQVRPNRVRPTSGYSADGRGFGSVQSGKAAPARPVRPNRVRTGIPVAGTLAAQRFPKNRRGIKNRGGSFPGSEFPFSAFQSVFRNGCRDFGTKKSGSAVYKTGINAQATFVYIKHGRSRNGIPLLRACRSGGLLIAMLKVKFAVRLKGGIKWNSH